MFSALVVGRNVVSLNLKTGKITGTILTGGVGIWGVAKELGKDIVVYHGKRGLGTAVLTGAALLCPLLIKMITNSTKVVKVAMSISNSAAAAIRVSENIAYTPLVACDFLLFGEYVLTCHNTS